MAYLDNQVSGYLVNGVPLEGLMVRSVEPRADSRGSFSELFCDSWDLGIEPSQWSWVESSARVLRGMHLHRNHDEYFLLMKGKCCVGLRDIRKGSPTEGRSCLLEFRADEQRAFVAFPRGLVHGWYFYFDSWHIQSTSREHREYNELDNLGCHWSDPGLEIPWPENPELVSERADAFQSLEMLIEQTHTRINQETKK